MSKLSIQDFNKVMHDFNQFGADVIAEHLKSHQWRCEHVYWLNAFQAYYTAVPSASKDITKLKEKHINGLIEYYSKNV